MTDNDSTYPQAGKRRMTLPPPVAMAANDGTLEREMLAQMDPDTVFMMGDMPRLARMPERPTLLDFFRYRFGKITYNHLLQSAKLALDGGHDEKIVMACLLHDISNGALMRADHGYWSAQLVRPYVDEEVAWAVEKHQALRFLPDESVGYGYPEAYAKYFGEDYVPPPHIKREMEEARNHPWYMTCRIVTMNDVYAFQDDVTIEPEIFEDIIGRNFKQPEEGLGFDGSSTAHMWRTMIWPNNFL
jgi:hypothetical protein